MKTPVTKAPLEVGQWYIDPHTEQQYKLLEVGAETVRVADEWGTERVVNRMLWERDMKPLATQVAAGADIDVPQVPAYRPRPGDERRVG